MIFIMYSNIFSIEYTVLAGQGDGYSQFHYLGTVTTKKEGYSLFFLSDEAAVLAPFVTRIMFVHSNDEIAHFRNVYSDFNSFNYDLNIFNNEKEFDFCLVPADFDQTQITLATRTPMGIEAPTMWINSEEPLDFTELKNTLKKINLVNAIIN